MAFWVPARAAIKTRAWAHIAWFCATVLGTMADSSKKPQVRDAARKSGETAPRGNAADDDQLLLTGAFAILQSVLRPRPRKRESRRS